MFYDIIIPLLAGAAVIIAVLSSHRIFNSPVRVVGIVRRDPDVSSVDLSRLVLETKNFDTEIELFDKIVSRIAYMDKDSLNIHRGFEKCSKCNLIQEMKPGGQCRLCGSLILTQTNPLDSVPGDITIAFDLQDYLQRVKVTREDTLSVHSKRLRDMEARIRKLEAASVKVVQERKVQESVIDRARSGRREVVH